VALEEGQQIAFEIQNGELPGSPGRVHGTSRIARAKLLSACLTEKPSRSP